MAQPEQTTLPPGTPFATSLDGQPPTQFGDEIFPCAYHRLLGEQRDHIHEYPHRDAGAPEKLGRKLYTVAIRGLFYSNLEQFPDLYPGAIDRLQHASEAGTTDTFVHPSVGSIQAYIKRWERYRDPKNRAGEYVDIVMQEDQQVQFLQGDISQLARNATLEAGAEELAAQLTAVQQANTLLMAPPTMSLFGAIQTITNEITGIGDTVGMYGNLVQAKAQQLSNLCGQMDNALELQDPRSYAVVEALHDLWASSIFLVNNAQNQGVSIQQYTVPTTMPLTAVSARLYNGDTSHTDDLLSLNNIPDPMRVKAGTKINYYPAS
jgi:prophage DNA circulation protein